MLGLVNKNGALSRSRKKRLIAFIIDSIVIVSLIYSWYLLTGRPDYPAVHRTMQQVKIATDPREVAQLTNEVLLTFQMAYGTSLVIWFFYEMIAQCSLKGATIGKKIMGLSVEPIKKKKTKIGSAVNIVMRSGVKCLFLYLFQGFPFLIACLTMFTNEEARSGFDIFARTRVKEA